MENSLFSGKCDANARKNYKLGKSAMISQYFTQDCGSFFLHTATPKWYCHKRAENGPQGSRATDRWIMCLTLQAFANVIVGYLAIGAVVSLVHPLLRRQLRESLHDLTNIDVRIAAIFLKPLICILVFLLYCVLWPIAWLNAGKSEKKAQQAADAQLERLRPFAQIYSKINAPVTYAGGDGSSFEQAVVLVGATLLSGPRAEHDFIKRNYVGYEFRKQSLKQQNGRTYDALEFMTVDGEIKTIYFDISGYFPRGASV